MTDADITDSIKAAVYFDLGHEDTVVGSESFWVKPRFPVSTEIVDGEEWVQFVGEVDNVLAFAPFTLGDLVLCRLLSGHDFPAQVVGLAARTSRAGYFVSVTYEGQTDIIVDEVSAAKMGLAASAVARHLAQAGCTVERLFARSNGVGFAVLLPVEVEDWEAWWDDMSFPDMPEAGPTLIHVDVEASTLPDDPLWLPENVLRTGPHPAAAWEEEPHPEQGRWEPSSDPEFLAALARARKEGHVLPWCSDTHLCGQARELWLQQARVREAVQEGNYWGVAVYSFRMAAPTEMLSMLPPLDGPLL